MASFSKVFGKELVAVDTNGAVVQLYISNSRRHDETPRGSDFWHSDNTYKKTPAAATALYALELPPEPGSTSTMLMDAALAHEALPPALKARVAQLWAEHVSNHNAGVSGGTSGGGGHEVETRQLVATHPVVRRHPETGRGSLFVNPLYTTRLLDSDGGEVEDSRELLDAVFHHMFGSGAPTAAGEPSVWVEGGLYRAEGRYSGHFEWQRPGDLLIWDNARMLHRATTLEGMAADSTRRMLRCSVEGTAPTPMFSTLR